jgi:hypothetical protein
MSGFIKSTVRRNARRFGRWLTSDNNLPRLRATKQFFETAIGDPNSVSIAQQTYANLIYDQSKAANLTKYEQKFYSQFGEDGLILHFFDKIGAPNKTFIEFGIEDGKECNSANLAINFGWKGLFIEGDPALAERASDFYHGHHGIDPEHVQIKNHFITLENVNDLFKQHGFEGEVDVLSIDIDGVDYWVWEAINIVKPRMVIAEYNAVLGRDRSITVPYDAAFDRYQHDASGTYFGISLKAACKLAEKKGYVLVGCESSGANAFFVRRDLAEGKLDEFTPDEAFYPCAPRLRTQTEEEQWNAIKHLKFVDI